MKEVRIEGKIIGDLHPAYIITEIGGNFSKLSEGKTLIDKAILSSANAVKIQTFKADKLVSKYASLNMPGIGGKKTIWNSNISSEIN